MEYIYQILKQTAYEFSIVQPMLGTYLHVLLSALFTIYTGSHASLTRPTSAAKSAKIRKSLDEDDENGHLESLRKMEGLSPSDAIMLPIITGVTLVAFYFIITWLEDPAILNTILNWYFAVFGLLGVAKMFTDAMGLVTSLVLPSKYTSDGRLWEVKPKQRTAIATVNQSNKRDSPLPGALSRVKLPSKVVRALWTLRELPSKRIHVRAYVHQMLEANFYLGPQGCLSLMLALAATLYFNLVDKPWWLTNILGYSFAYAFLQLMSPTTFSTGSLILVALFVYDIYFVFYTPFMVTVATKLDIPAKMLFPRPSYPKDDPAKQALAMLGLGDIVVPGLLIGFALRFDLYLFYLRKQKSQGQPDTRNRNGGSTTLETKATEEKKSTDIVKPEYRRATGGWSERLWVGKHAGAPEPVNGGVFPKTYFYACICGYTVGMITTLGVMSVSRRAQPALLYLVPGVLTSLWGSALVNGDLEAMWNYDELEPEDVPKDKPDEPKKALKSIFSWSRQDEMEKWLENHWKGGAKESGPTAEEDKKESETKGTKGAAESSSEKKGVFTRDRKTEYVFFSINFPGNSSSEPEPQREETTPDGKPEIEAKR